MSIKQISVFLENKPGTLKKMTGVLAAKKVDMRALSLAETKDFGIARIIVDDVFEAVNILKDADFVAKLTSVLAVKIPDVPGGLDQLLSIFSEAEVNIEYMYAFLGGAASEHAYMIFRVQDRKAAAAALRAKGIQVVDQEHISQL